MATVYLEAMAGLRRLRVLLADDHAVVRQGLRVFLAADGGLQVVGEASNGREALAQVARLRPDVVLMDLRMPGMDGVGATRAIKARYPQVAVILLADAPEDPWVMEAVWAGASACLAKDASPAELIQAVRAVGQGGAGKRALAMGETLTPRETEILRMLALGLSNKRIAQQLELSELTVKTHVSHLLSKLGLSSRTQAAVFAVREGLVDFEGKV